MSVHPLRDIVTRGQVFTPAAIVERMLGLLWNDPSSDFAFAHIYLSVGSGAA